MTFDTLIALYVTDPAASARFYEALLDRAALEASPTFALFALGSGVKLGLWGAAGVRPAAGGAPGACEIALSVETPAAVDAVRRTWGERGAWRSSWSRSIWSSAAALSRPIRTGIGFGSIARPDRPGRRQSARAICAFRLTHAVLYPT